MACTWRMEEFMKRWFPKTALAAAAALGTVLLAGAPQTKAAEPVRTEESAELTETARETEAEENAEARQGQTGSADGTETKTGEPARSISKEQMDQLVAFIREKLEENGLETREDIDDAIREGEQEFGIRLEEDAREKIGDVAEKVQSLGLSEEVLLEEGQKLYDKYGDKLSEEVETVIQQQLVEPVKAAVKQTVTDTVKTFFRDLGTSVKGFFQGAFAE